MTISHIQTLKPNVSQDEAIHTFASHGISSLYWRVRNGPLQRIGPVYVPFVLYRVHYEMVSIPQTRLFAMDAVDGSLDLFEFPRVPRDSDLLTLETRNHLRSILSAANAEKMLRDKVLRVIFQQGFFKLCELKLDVARQPIELYLPYWLAFYGGQTVRCRVIDATRRRIEGAKASAFFEEWLAA